MSDAAEKLRFLLELQDRLGGAIPFERWMREALYHEKFGYYTANIRGIGRRGDFTTWPVLHDGLARAIARWALANKPPGRWHLIEIGAGTGELAAAVLRAIGWWNRPHCHIVEVSPPLREEQRKRLGRKAAWHGSVTEALAGCGGHALILSNELVDAFPCRIFQRSGLRSPEHSANPEGCGPSQGMNSTTATSAWRELALRIENGRVTETWLDASLPASTVFDHEWPAGQRVEVQESYRAWLHEWLPAWKSGTMLTIDYGDTCPDIYRRRPRGTLRAYAHHQRLEGAEAYAGFGLRDLTVDVNFSDLMRWGEAAGLPSGPCLSLSGFLTGQRIPFPEDLRQGAGEAFRVLVQKRKVASRSL